VERAPDALQATAPPSIAVISVGEAGKSRSGASSSSSASRVIATGQWASFAARSRYTAHSMPRCSMVTRSGEWGRGSRMKSMAMTMPPWTAQRPPASPVPAAETVTGVREEVASARTWATSSSHSG
jgi:hypothetical protein